MFKVAIYAATTVILGWLLLCTYALTTGQAAELHDLGTVTVDIIRALITEPVHDLAPITRGVLPAAVGECCSSTPSEDAAHCEARHGCSNCVNESSAPE